MRCLFKDGQCFFSQVFSGFTPFVFSVVLFIATFHFCFLNHSFAAEPDGVEVMMQTGSFLPKQARKQQESEPKRVPAAINQNQNKNQPNHQHDYKGVDEQSVQEISGSYPIEKNSQGSDK